MGQKPVYFIRGGRLFTLVEKGFLHHLFNIGILALYNFLLITPVRHMDHRHGMFLFYLLVIFQYLDGMPSGGRMVRITLLHHAFQCLDLLFDLRRIIQNVVLHPLLAVVDHRMKQNIQSGAPGRRNRHYRNISQHFGQTVHVDLHPPLFHHVHHVQRQDDGLPKFQKLQGQVQVPLQGGRVHHVYDGINVVIHGTFPGDLLLNGIAGQGVDSRRVHNGDIGILIACLAFHPLHCNPGPVCNLQPGAGKGVEEGCLAAVGVADAGYVDVFFLILRFPVFFACVIRAFFSVFLISVILCIVIHGFRLLIL